MMLNEEEIQRTFLLIVVIVIAVSFLTGPPGTEPGGDAVLVPIS